MTTAQSMPLGQVGQDQLKRFNLAAFLGDSLSGLGRLFLVVAALATGACLVFVACLWAEGLLLACPEASLVGYLRVRLPRLAPPLTACLSAREPFCLHFAAAAQALFELPPPALAPMTAILRQSTACASFS